MPKTTINRGSFRRFVRILKSILGLVLLLIEVIRKVLELVQ